MKKKYIILSTFVFASLAGRAQKNDGIFKKDTIRKTEIEAMYGHYIQDGNSSAITGGQGTEKLIIYSPYFNIKTTGLNRHTTSFKGGCDVISSASTDKIDYVVSSASILDARGYASLNHAAPIGRKRMTVNAGVGFSLESDYFSLPVSLGISYTSKNKMRSYSFDLQMFFDDLRWGRVKPGLYKPQKLIYPSELRTKQWYETTKRHSYNFKFGINQVINKRNRIGLFPEFTYQEGLLVTPFHRVYFNDNSLRVENLPKERLKFLLGLKLNSFVGGRIILKNTIDLYSDNFGITGIGVENETAIKFNYKFTLSPFIRIYRQKGSMYFAPYKQHLTSEEFYTSDYDLSTFTTYKFGLNLRYAPFKYLRKRVMFNELQLRYAFYYRSNGMQAHIMSCVFNGVFMGRGKR